MSVGALAGALATARRINIEIRHVVVGATALGATMVALGLMPTLGLAFPVTAAVGFSSMVFMTASTAIVQVRADPSMRGRVLALQSIVFLGSTPIGGPIVGAICDAFGPRTGLFVGGVAALGAALYGWFADRKASEPALPAAVRTT
jgi:predicted MFS family arabinose efflux permease